MWPMYATVCCSVSYRTLLWVLDCIFNWLNTRFNHSCVIAPSSGYIEFIENPIWFIARSHFCLVHGKFNFYLTSKIQFTFDLLTFQFGALAKIWFNPYRCQWCKHLFKSILHSCWMTGFKKRPVYLVLVPRSDTARLRRHNSLVCNRLGAPFMALYG